MNETLKLIDECRAQCEVTSQRLPEDREHARGVYEKAAGQENTNQNFSFTGVVGQYLTCLCTFYISRSVSFIAGMQTNVCVSGVNKAWKGLSS